MFLCFVFFFFNLFYLLFYFIYLQQSTHLKTAECKNEEVPFIILFNFNFNFY